MQCPVCNQKATTLIRNAFSFQGVSYLQSMQGKLKCRECGALLRVSGYGKRFWLFFAPSILLLFVFLYTYQSILPAYGIDAGVAWIVLLFLIYGTFTFAIFKNAKVEKVEG